MKYLLLTMIGLTAAGPSFSQEAPEIRLKPGHQLKEYFSTSEHFRFDQFRDGQIYYENGKSSATHKFNYDIVEGRMLVIQGFDTVPIVPFAEQKIRLYKIGTDIFLNLSKGEIVEVLNPKDSISLGVNVKYEIRRREVITNNGYTTGYEATGAISTRARTGADLILRKLTSYYIIGTEGKVYTANRSKILKDFPHQKQMLSEFIDDRKIDFKTKSDLEQLVTFLNSLLKKT